MARRRRPAHVDSAVGAKLQGAFMSNTPVTSMTAQNRLQSTSEPLRPRALKTASREIFRKSRASQGRSAAYRFGASRENAHAYENVRQDRQSLQTDPV